MTRLTLHVWHEEISLDDAFLELHRHGMAQTVLQELTKHLLYQRSFGEYKLEDTLSETPDALLQAFCQKRKIKTPDELKAWLTMNRHTRESLMMLLLHQEKVQRLQRLVVPDEAIKEAFLKRKPRLDTVTFGLIRVDTERVAKELFYRIRDDHDDFATLARQFSSGPEALFGGIIGPKPTFELNPELRKQILPLKPGELTEPFTLDGSVFLLARLIRIDPAQLKPMLEASIREELFGQWTERQVTLANVQLNLEDLEEQPVVTSERPLP